VFIVQREGQQWYVYKIRVEGSLAKVLFVFGSRRQAEAAGIAIAHAIGGMYWAQVDPTNPKEDVAAKSRLDDCCKECVHRYEPQEVCYQGPHCFELSGI